MKLFNIFRKKQDNDPLPIKVDGKPILYPTQWAHVKFKTFVKLIGKTKLESIKIILGDLGIDTTKAQIEGLQHIMPKSKFLDKLADYNLNPTSIGKYQVPVSITTEAWDQYDKIGDLIRKVREQSESDQVEALAYYAAIYIQGHREPFDAEKANYLAGEFMDLSCLEVMSAGLFFQLRYLSMESGLSMNSLHKTILQKKRTQDLKKYLKPLDRMLRSTASRDM